MDTILRMGASSELRGGRTMNGWHLGDDGLLRPLILRSALGFWTNQDADLWVNQRMLVTHVRQAILRVDKDTVREVLDGMARHGILIRKSPSPRRTVYRVTAKFCDPTAPGYAREIDELLEDPMSWVDEQGQFFRFGRGPSGAMAIHPVASFPHHFAKHAWMRAWIHTLRQGPFREPASALREIGTAARAAALDLVWLIWSHRGRADPIGKAARAFEAARLFRAGAPPAVGSGEPPTTDRAEEGLRILHEMCGHDHLQPVHGPPLMHASGLALDEALVYRGLDALVQRRLGLEKGPADIIEPSPIPDRSNATADPLLIELAPTIWALDPTIRATLTDHRRAWGGGLFSAPR